MHNQTKRPNNRTTNKGYKHTLDLKTVSSNDESENEKQTQHIGLHPSLLGACPPASALPAGCMRSGPSSDVQPRLEGVYH